MTKGNDWQTRAARWICIGLGILSVYLVLKYAALALLPFIVAWGVAVLVYPLSRKTASKLHLPQKLLAVIYVILLLTVLGLLIWVGVTRLLAEIESLLLRLSEKDNALAVAVDGIWGQVTGFLERFSFLGGEGNTDMGGMVSDALRQTVSSLGGELGSAVGAFLAAAPSVIFGVVVTLMACLYLSADYERIRNRLLSLLPSGARETAETVRRRAQRVLTGYGRAYLILGALTFAEVLVGLWILKMPYAFLIALAVAAVDILPFLGSGIVLVPWSVFLILGGNVSAGLGLLILYGVLTLVRQIAEPHLLGGSLGVHPLLSLFCVFVGWQLFGLLGMFLGPAAALCLQEGFRREPS